MAALTELFDGSMSPTVLGASSVIFVLYLIFQLFSGKKKEAFPDAPTFGKPGMPDYDAALVEGHKKVCIQFLHLIPC